MSGADLTVPCDPILEAFGVPATVTRPAPDDTPIETTGVWVPPLTVDSPSGLQTKRREPLRIFALPRADVPTVPTGTVIEAPEVLDGPVRTWRVDGFDRYEFDLTRVLVVPAD